ncbi:aldo/keto reductase [Paenarthrobacter sp. RAF54_2]|uniref:aldo/keto reductase n=1 Tax=Paenarthrobacter sp. RAF54_2 TaxID=3233061 RepID=UPI003F9A99C6
MKQRILGEQGLTTSALGYGSMGISLAYGSSNEQGGIKAIRRAHELGVTFFDTAELYGWGENERIVGKAVAPFRDDVTVATKFGYNPDWSLNSNPVHIREVVDNSLKYLDTGHIDVLYQHRVDPAVPIEEVAGAVKDLIDVGKVKYFGLSEAGEKTIRAAHEIQPVSVLQTEYSLFERDAEQLFPVLGELGIGFVPYSPLGRGFLTGTAQPASAYDAQTDMRANDPRWQPGNFEKNVEATRQLSEFAHTRGVTVAQLALAWLLAQGEHIVPIPGSRDPRRVEENIHAVNVDLTRSDLDRIAGILPSGGFGARYRAEMLPSWV